MEKTILAAAIILLCVLMTCMIYLVIKGPRKMDRMVTINAISTMVTALICLLSRYMNAPYLLDVALVYALLSFVGITLLTRFLTASLDEGDKA